MIKEEKFKNAKPVDFFNELTEEEKAESEFMAYIAMRIHDKRVSLNMTQQEFADLNNVSQTMVSKWESGDYNFSISNLRKILAALGMKILLQEEEQVETVLMSEEDSGSKWKAASSGGSAFSAYSIAASPNHI